MQPYLTTLLIFLIMFSCTEPIQDNPELRDIAEQDQLDRKTNNQNISANDHQRLVRVKELIAADSLFTANDYFHAALVLQHSEAISDYLKANELAQKSVKLDGDNPDSKRLIAQSKDRYLTHQNKPQHYGTQRRTFGELEYLYPIDLDAVTDEERKKLETRTIPELLESFNKKHGKQFARIEEYFFTDSLIKVYYPEIRAEMIGSFGELLAQINYPEEARKNNITGKVLIEYTVDVAGSVSNAMVVEGLGYGCDEEALRVMKLAKYKNYMGEPIERRTRIPFGED